MPFLLICVFTDFRLVLCSSSQSVQKIIQSKNQATIGSPNILLILTLVVISGFLISLWVFFKINQYLKNIIHQPSPTVISERDVISNVLTDDQSEVATTISVFSVQSRFIVSHNIQLFIASFYET